MYITYPLLSLVSILMAACAARLVVALRRFRIRQPVQPRADMPTVSVCIPVRNEMHMMTDCLERVLASDYPKIEVIVFDDSSTDDTSMLVRSFAHAGVRFVPGRTLPEGWLGKNHALSILAQEASGERLLFLDVDTAIDRTTISQLMGYMDAYALDMVSVLPIRREAWQLSTLFGYLRYFWELIIAGRAMPATSSGLWLIDRTVLQKECGGFAAFPADVRPEQRLAERLGSHRYHCLLSTVALGVSENKQWKAQLEAARRLLYPIAGGTPMAGLSALVLLLLLNVPTALFIIGLALHLLGVVIWSGSLLLAGMGLYGIYTHTARPASWYVSALLWPLLLLQEVWLLVASVIGYARHTVTWKGRLVTANPVKTDYLAIDK